MTNREYLIKCTNVYDLLCRMGDNLGVCIIGGVTGYDYKYCDENCEKCIAEWLNEEKEWNDENA